jgi:Rad3-related DNA helicase
LLYYNGSKEKSDVIIQHQMSADTILIGPTLNEGIDLPGDLCRFIIITKMPYPSIKDRLVDAKMKIFPYWYNSTTSTQIIQGIGRGNRFEDDYCSTYILDACFLKLYTDTQNQYPTYIQRRIKVCN